MIVQQILNELQSRKIINWIDQPCCICHCQGGTIQSHLEDYSKIFEFKPICVECHMKLHMRFRYPTYWIKHLIDVSNGYQCPEYSNMREYFKVKKGKFINPEYEGIDPLTIGNEWFHKLSLEPISINKFKRYNDE
jgi:hypothetical protein